MMYDEAIDILEDTLHAFENEDTTSREVFFRKMNYLIT